MTATAPRSARTNRRLPARYIGWPHAPFEIPGDVTPPGTASRAAPFFQENWDKRLPPTAPPSRPRPPKFERRVMKAELPASWAAT